MLTEQEMKGDKTVENNVVFFAEEKAYDLATIFHALEYSNPGISHSEAWEAAKTIYDLYMAWPEIHDEESPEEYAVRICEEVLK